MNTTTLLILGILFIGMGFIFGFMVGTMLNIDKDRKDG